MIYVRRGAPYTLVEIKEPLPPGASLPCAMSTCRRGSVHRFVVYKAYKLCCLTVCRVKTSQTYIRCDKCRGRWTEYDYQAKTGSIVPSTQDASFMNKQKMRFSVKVHKEPGVKLGISFVQKKNGVVVVKRIAPNSPIRTSQEKVAGWHGALAEGQTVVAINGCTNIATPAQAAALIASSHDDDVSHAVTIVTRETILWRTTPNKTRPPTSPTTPGDEQRQSLVGAQDERMTAPMTATAAHHGITSTIQEIV